MVRIYAYQNFCPLWSLHQHLQFQPGEGTSRGSILVVRRQVTSEKSNLTDALLLRQVWTSCGGETPADEENLGPVSYTPMQGFPGHMISFVACHAVYQDCLKHCIYRLCVRLLLPLPEPDALPLPHHLAAVQEPHARGHHSDQVNTRKLKTNLCEDFIITQKVPTRTFF